MPETRTDAIIDRLARPQHGLLELRQGEPHGVTDRQIRHRTRGGAVRRLEQGVYATMGTNPTWEQAVMAACLAAGAAALASHRTAAVLWSLLGMPMPVEIVVPYAKGPTPRGATVHRSTDLRDIDAARRNGIPVTNPIRTVGDLGAVAPGWYRPRSSAGSTSSSSRQRACGGWSTTSPDPVDVDWGCCGAPWSSGRSATSGRAVRWSRCSLRSLRKPGSSSTTSTR